ncbi:MAG: CHASE3 domain-containing protein, partial [Hoeflea sp.]|nr:CHASE3 domain-containing protein [Hoeflea sp.]
MLKNLSVSTKGFAAFAVLAFIAIAASGFIYTRAVAVTSMVEHSQAMGQLLNETAELTDQVNHANLALKNFLLTGNRDFANSYEGFINEVDTQFASLETSYAQHASSELPRLSEAKANVAEWRATVVDRQILLMRDPMTVELARALELTGSGTRLLAEFEANVESVTSSVLQQASEALAEEKAALAAVEYIALGASILVALAAAVMGLLNFQLVSRPLSRLADITARLAKGELDVTIEKGGKDEIGRMADSMQIFREA